MTTTMAVQDERFLIPCTACFEFFNAFDAEWCDCIGSDVTLKCTHCGHCFCRAANEFKTELWRLAPASLHALRKERLGGAATQRDRFATVSNEAASEISRPMVLVVDDSKLIRATTMRIVRSLGYGAIEAADADMGIALTLLYRPEVVLSDALMPKVDGRAMCRTIKNSPSTQQTKVVIMTGLYKAPRYKYEAFHSFGVDEYLLKPIEPEELRKVLHRLVGPPALRAAEDFHFDIVA